MRSMHRLAARGAILVSVFTLAGCATTGVTLDRVMRQEPSGYVVVGTDQAAGLVTVFRAGQPLSARLPLTLQAGDEIETGAGGAALIQQPNGGIVVVDGNSRVRIGSLEVLFGRVFAAVRGLFSVESENVVAGVEGTEFLFEAGPDNEVHVVVLEGRVTCTSKTGRWRPTRLTAGQGFVATPGTSPSVRQASQSELDGIRGWVRRVVNPLRLGYCCDAGRVYQSRPDACRGAFFPDVFSAQRACARPPEPNGWCCDAGRVTPSTASRCEGKFYPDQASAERACAPPPEPGGWCCEGGRVRPTTRARCEGSFYEDRARAERACAPPEPTGWCCDAGRVTPGPRSKCRGTFYSDRAAALKACAQQKVGWCCLPDYKLSQMNASACRANRGTFYTDEGTARNACIQIQ